MFLFTFIILHSYNQWRNQRFESEWQTDKKGPLTSVWVHQTTLRKNVRNDGEFRCGWLYQNPKSPENNPKNTKEQPTENQMNAKTET